MFLFSKQYSNSKNHTSFGTPVCARAALKIRLCCVCAENLTKNVFFLFSLQPSLENSGSAEKTHWSVLMCTPSQNWNNKNPQTPALGFHPKYFSTRLGRLSENYWNPQASCRGRKDELKITVFIWHDVLKQCFSPASVVGCVSGRLA